MKGYLRRAAAHEALKNWEDAVRDYEKVRAPGMPCNDQTLICRSTVVASMAFLLHLIMGNKGSVLLLGSLQRTSPRPSFFNFAAYGITGEIWNLCIEGGWLSPCVQVKEMDSEVQGITGMLGNAKKELKKSKRVDYYKLLDISQDANDADIKKVPPIALGLISGGIGFYKRWRLEYGHQSAWELMLQAWWPPVNPGGPA